jgi:hypothetical protein
MPCEAHPALLVARSRGSDRGGRCGTVGGDVGVPAPVGGDDGVQVQQDRCSDGRRSLRRCKSVGLASSQVPLVGAAGTRTHDFSISGAWTIPTSLCVDDNTNGLGAPTPHLKITNG